MGVVAGLTPFELGDEEDLAAGADRLKIGGLVDLAVDRDGGFLFEVVAEAIDQFYERPTNTPGDIALDLGFDTHRMDSAENYSFAASVKNVRCSGSGAPKNRKFPPSSVNRAQALLPPDENRT